MMTVGELMHELAHLPPDAEVVVDERDLRGGYVWDITSIFGPDSDDKGHESQVMIRCTDVCRHAS
jgi:hypothetical protein